MNRKQKEIRLEEIRQLLTDAHFYMVDCEGLTANQTHELRRRLHEEQIQCKVLPNALLKLLFKDTERETLLPLLKKSSMLLITQEAPSVPAKVLKAFYKELNLNKPTLKGALAYGETFIGENQLKPLSLLKSKEELIGDLLNLLQSPTTQLLSALESSSQNMVGLLQTLSERS